MSYKNPNRVLAGKLAYAKRQAALKAGQDARDKNVVSIITAVVILVFFMGLILKS